MEGGIFLLLCLLALFIGSKAKRNQGVLSEAEKRKKEKIKRFMYWMALVLIICFLVLFIPAAIQNIKIAMDTHFDKETYLSIALCLFGVLTLYTVLKRLKKG